MAEIDEELRESDVPIAGRPLKGLGAVAKRLGTSVMGGPLRTGPVPGVYEGESLSAHIFAWFNRRYGDRQKKDWSLGSTIYVLEEDPWLVKLPRVYGRIKLVCQPDLSIEFPNIGGSAVIGNPEFPTLNIFKQIVDVPQAKLMQLSLDEHREYMDFFRRALTVFQALDALAQTEPLAKAAQFDLTSAAKNCCGSKEDYGQSRWLSLQGAEKSLKLFISQRGEDFPFSHNLKKLAERAMQLGLTGVADEMIQKVQCQAAVRYGGIEVKLSEAVDAQTTAFSITERVFSSLENCT